MDGEAAIPYWPYTDVTPKDLKEESKEMIDDAMMAASGVMPGPHSAAKLLDLDSGDSDSDEGDKEGLLGEGE